MIERVINSRFNLDRYEVNVVCMSVVVFSANMAMNLPPIVFAGFVIAELAVPGFGEVNIFD